MSSNKGDLAAMAAAERADLFTLLRGLDEEQWATPSLCAPWTVRDVAVHVVSYDGLSPGALAATFLRGGLRVSAVNEVALQRFGGLDGARVIGLVEAHLQPRGLTAGFGGGIALTDGTIHHQDIRRALGLARTVPPARLRHVLDFAIRAPTIPVKKNARGLRLVADDLDFSTGEGPEVSGPGEALLMALAGRADAIPDLSGPGLAVLSQRIRT